MRKNYFYNLLLTASNLVIPLLSFPYAARVLGPAGIGRAQFVFLLCQYLALLAALGIPIYGAREVARLHSQPAALASLLRSLLTVNFLTGLVLFAGFLFCIFTLPALSGARPLYLTGSLMVLLSFTSVEWVYTGLETFRQLALRSVALKLLSLGGLFLLVHHPTDLALYLALQVGTVLGYNLLNFRGLVRMLKGGMVQIRPHLRPLLLLFGTTIASTLYTTFDSILLGLLASDAAVGYYTAATKVAKIALPLITAYAVVLLPGITVAIAEEKPEALQTHLHRSYAYITGLGVPAMAGLFVFAPALIHIFSGAAFAPAILTLRLLAPMPLLVGLGYFWGYQVALPLGKERILLTAALWGVGVSLLGNFMLVPVLAQDGAAVSGIGAELAVTLAYYLGVRKNVAVPGSARLLGEALLAALPFAIILFLPPRLWEQSSSLLWLTLLGGSTTLTYIVLQLFLFRNEALRQALGRYLPFLRPAHP